MLSGLGMERGRGRTLWGMLCAWSAAVVMMRTTSCCVTVRSVHCSVNSHFATGLGNFTVMQHRLLMIALAHHQVFELAAYTQAVYSNAETGLCARSYSATVST